MPYQCTIENIYIYINHLIDDEQLVFNIDDQLLFEMLLLYAPFKKLEEKKRKKTHG